jgi:hypothetical protein
MKRIFLFILAFFLLPFYPILRRIKKMGDKLQIGERIIVITQTGKNRKVSIT